MLEDFSTLSNQNQNTGGIEQIITRVFRSLIDLSAERMDGEVRETLSILGEYSGSDRCYVILFSENGAFLQTVHEWCADGIEPTTGMLAGRPADILPWFTEQIKNLEIIRVTDREALRELAPAEYEQCRLEGIQSLLIVPMVYKDIPVGLLGFDSVRSPKNWSDEQIVLLKVAGEILINALQRKRAEDDLRTAYQSLEERVEERTRELHQRSRVGEALRDILRVLNSNRELPEVLGYIVTQACQLLNATATLIRRADLPNQEATTEAGHNLPVEFEAIRRTRMYYSATDLILMSRRPVVIADVQTTYTPMLENRETLDDIQVTYVQTLLKYYRSMLSVPLFIKNEIYGSLTFFFSERRKFPEEDIQLAMSLGDQAALAIENARLYREEHIRREEAERRRQVAEGLRDVVAVLNSNRSLDDILQQIVDQAVNLLKSDAVAIYRLWRKENVLVIRASYGLSDSYVSQIRIPVGKGIAGHAIVSRKPVAVSDSLPTVSVFGEHDLLEEERQALESLVEHYRAFLSVPLVGKDEIYGAITLYYCESRSFSQEEIDLAVVFADQASLAIENARLRSQSEQNAVAMERNRLARDLHDAVTQTLFSASLIAEVLPRIWERNPDEGRRRIEELRQLSRGALAEMRTLLLELRPSALIEAKLSDLLRQLSEAVTGRARLPVALTVTGEFQLEPDVQVALYRIAQEVLNNIVKHAGAKRAAIRLTFTDELSEDPAARRRVELIIEDDGHGFDPAQVPPSHLGLGIMRERAQTINASLQIDSRIGSGTSVSVVWIE